MIEEIDCAEYLELLESIEEDEYFVDEEKWDECPNPS
jgi:hypothetical protein